MLVSFPCALPPSSLDLESVLELCDALDVLLLIVTPCPLGRDELCCEIDLIRRLEGCGSMSGVSCLVQVSSQLTSAAR